MKKLNIIFVSFTLAISKWVYISGFNALGPWRFGARIYEFLSLAVI